MPEAQKNAVEAAQCPLDVRASALEYAEETGLPPELGEDIAHVLQAYQSVLELELDECQLETLIRGYSYALRTLLNGVDTDGRADVIAQTKRKFRAWLKEHILDAIEVHIQEAGTSESPWKALLLFAVGRGDTNLHSKNHQPGSS